MRMKALLLPLLLAATTTHAADPKIPFEIYRLKNGLEVILSEDHHVPVVHVQVWYHVGSKDEQAGKTGFAHLFEHMMFQSARDIAEDTWFKKLDAIGGFGINGTTNSERTNYFESVPSTQLALALWMESDRMGFLLDTLDDKAFRNQQDVVRNERRQSYEMRPYGMTDLLRAEAMYPPSHPYHHTTIGSHEDLERASVEDVRQFFKTFYVPSNATLAIVGDLDPAKTRELVEKYFGSLPAAPVPPHAHGQAPDAPAATELAMEANVQLPRFEYVWHGPVSFSADEEALDLYAEMMGGGKSSRLYKRLVYETQSAQSASASLESRELGGQLVLAVTMKPGHTIEEGRKLVDEELARAAKQPFTAAELERAKTHTEANLIRRLETDLGRAGDLQTANHYTHDPNRANEEIARYRAVTLDGVRAAGARWLSHPKLVITIVKNPKAPLGGRRIGAAAEPGKAAPPPVATVEKKPVPSEADPWRKHPPKGSAPPDVRLPAPQRATLANGLPLILVETHELPIVEAYLLIYAGAERTTPSQAGLADLTAGLLTEGTAKHDALALANALDDLGARLGASANADAAYLSLNTLSSKLDPALDLFSEVLTTPAFADKDLERVRSQRLAALLQQRDLPAIVASNVAGRVVYGDKHPYAFPLLGTEESLKALGRKEVLAYYTALYRPNNATLIVVGDTTLAAITAKLEARLAGWKPGPVDKAGPPDAPPPPAARKVALVDQPQASQSVIGLAQVGVSRRNPDYVPLVVANYILGGSFSSRINMNLREKNGYSYGASSRFNFLRGPGLFFAGGNVRGNVTKEALSELLKEVVSLRSGRVTDEELAETKSSLIDKMPQRFETNSAIAGMLAELVRNDLPLDWYATFAKKVNAVTALDVQRVARKYLTPERAQIVVVGDRAAVEGKLKELDLGPIELRGRTGELEP